LYYDVVHKIELFEPGTRVRIVASEAPTSLPNGTVHIVIVEPGDADHGEPHRDTGVIDADGDFLPLFCREAEIVDDDVPLTGYTPRDASDDGEAGGDDESAHESDDDDHELSAPCDYSGEYWPPGTRVMIRPDIATSNDPQWHRWADQVGKVFTVEAPPLRDMPPIVRGDFAYKGRFVLAGGTEVGEAPKQDPQLVVKQGDYVQYADNIAFSPDLFYLVRKDENGNLHHLDDDGDWRAVIPREGRDRIVPTDEVRIAYERGRFTYDNERWPAGSIVRPRKEWLAFGKHYASWFSRKETYKVVQRRASSGPEVYYTNKSGEKVHIYATKARFELVTGAVPEQAHAATSSVPEFDTTPTISDNEHTVALNVANHHEGIRQYHGERAWAPGSIVEVDMFAYIDEPLLSGFDVGTRYRVEMGQWWPFIIDNSCSSPGEIHGGTPPLVRWFDLISPPQKDDTDE
jgi:hypothetical protein